MTRLELMSTRALSENFKLNKVFLFIKVLIFLFVSWTSLAAKIVPYGNESFRDPVFATTDPLNKKQLFVLEKSGKIHILSEKTKKRRPGVFLDISSKVLNRGEMGLLGLTFDPEFKENGFYYLYYNLQDSGLTKIVQRKSIYSPEHGYQDLNEEWPILEIEQPYSNHNGGMIDFGPDGNLYIAIGDGGLRDDPLNHAQNRSTLLGNILRIKPLKEGKYKIPSDNPFVKTPNTLPEIWAWGLRNVWRFSFDRDSGDLWAADVGQNKREEINLIEKAKNYGWPLYEAAKRYKLSVELVKDQQYENPKFEYSHFRGDQSITGGYVYRGQRFDEWNGRYFFGDYVSGKVWSLKIDPRSKDLSGLKSHGRVSLLSSFAQTSTGELLMMGLGQRNLYHFSK